jgi:hypothetical protein
MSPHRRSSQGRPQFRSMALQSTRSRGTACGLEPASELSKRAAAHVVDVTLLRCNNDMRETLEVRAQSPRQAASR